MRRLVLLLATGCFQPSAATGVPCSPALECPTGQACDRTGPVPTCVDRLGDAPIDAPRDAAADASPDASPDAFVPLVCPSGYEGMVGSASRYREVILPAPWDRAAADCADDSAGPAGRTHLMVVSNELERKLLDDNTLGVNWVGLSDRRGEGAYVWVTAEPTGNYPPASGAPWAPGQPSGGTDINCVYVGGLGTFDDERCAASLPYICECDAFANDPTRY